MRDFKSVCNLYGGETMMQTMMEVLDHKMEKPKLREISNITDEHIEKIRVEEGLEGIPAENFRKYFRSLIQDLKPGYRSAEIPPKVSQFFTTLLHLQYRMHDFPKDQYEQL